MWFTIRRYFEIFDQSESTIGLNRHGEFWIGKERYIGDTRNIIIKVFSIKSDIKTDK